MVISVKHSDALMRSAIKNKLKNSEDAFYMGLHLQPVAVLTTFLGFDS